MDIFIDESGSLNNAPSNYSQFFVVAMVCAKNNKALKRAHKRFVSSNLPDLRRADSAKKPHGSRKACVCGQMFNNNKFQELKGNVFSPELKRRFLAHFNRPDDIEVYFVKISNKRLTDGFCRNKARAFNYTLRLAIQYYIKNGSLPNHPYNLHLDERNEKTESRHFLCDYLNTELVLGGHCSGPFTVQYCDSSNVPQIQIADVFANIYYSYLHSRAYTDELKELYASGVIKGIFEFPL